MELFFSFFVIIFIMEFLYKDEINGDTVVNYYPVKDWGNNIRKNVIFKVVEFMACLLYTSPSPRDVEESRMPSSA